MQSNRETYTQNFIRQPDMARIVLSEGVTLRGARRMITKRGGSFRITQRNGRLYTFKKFKCVQPNTEAQIECRELLKRANVLAREDMARDGRREQWEKRAREMGYKTAMGCARAWYVAELKGEVIRRKEEEAREKTRKNEEEDNHMSHKKEKYDAGRKIEVIVIEKRWKTTGRRKIKSRSKACP